jgi:hypothetical protein
MVGGNTPGVGGVYPDDGYCHTLANVALFNPSQGGRYRAWHWGSDSSVTNNTLGELGSTPLYVGLPSAWGSVDLGPMFSPILW